MKKETKQTKQKEKTMVISKSEYGVLKLKSLELSKYESRCGQLLHKLDKCEEKLQEVASSREIILADRSRLRAILFNHNSKWYNRKIKF